MFPSCPSTLIPLSILVSMKPRARLRGIYIYKSITMIQSLYECAKTRVSLSLSMCVLFKHWKCSVAITWTMFPWATLRLKIDFERGWCDKMGVELIKILAIEQEKVEDGYRRYFDIVLKFDLGFEKKRIFL